MAANNQKQSNKPTASERKGLTTQEVVASLLQARPIFENVVKASNLPILWESELSFATEIVMSDPWQRLRFSTPESLTACLRNIANVGLTLNPLKHHCTLVPRWNDKLNALEAHIMPMYRGLAYLATQAGVSDIISDVVYRQDEFEVSRASDGDRFHHKINIHTHRGAEGNDFLGTYTAARMPKTGERKVEWIPAADIYKMREQSDSYVDKDGRPRPNSPWVRWFDEQAKKSGFKRATKRWEEAVYDDTKWQRLQTAVQLDHTAEGAGRIFEGQAEEVNVEKLSPEQIGEIEAAAHTVFDGEKAVQQYLAKVCGAYGKGLLADIPAKLHKEILERIAVAKKAMDDKVARAAKNKQKTAQKDDGAPAAESSGKQDTPA